jgi:cell division protein FtsI/penicillin-binding protein 2
MQLFQKRKWVYTFTGMCLFAAVLSLYWTFREVPQQVKEAVKVEKINDIRTILSEKLGPALLHSEFPGEVELPSSGENIKGKVVYTIDPDLQKAAEKLLKNYKPDYGAIVMMDASTGKVLALTSFQKKGDNTNLALRGTFPAASVFKIVTATAALDKYNVTPDTIVMFNGGNHTLYKKNVMSDKVNRWTRRIALREAFARSINTVFGRLSLERLSPGDLQEYASRFGFNQDIHSDLPFDAGFTEIPKEKNFHLTEMASGYNRVTRMSPIQGAMIASSVAEDGVMRVPYIVDRVLDSEGKVVFQGEPLTAGVTMSPKGAEKLQELMEATILQGTSRKSFRTLVKDKKFKELVIGGKTGSLMGDNPKGKVDWFVGYAMNENQKIAIGALTVNVNYWTVKSSYLAQTLFRAHFKEQFSRENEKFFNTASEREPASSGSATSNKPTQ